jgi:flagellar protein FliO/FliZ
VPDNLGPLLAFALVVALIPVVLWLVKRSPLVAGAQGGSSLRAVGTLAVSATQRVVVVEVNHGSLRRTLVLGVSPGQIVALHEAHASQAADGGDAR